MVGELRIFPVSPLKTEECWTITDVFFDGTFLLYPFHHKVLHFLVRFVMMGMYLFCFRLADFQVAESLTDLVASSAETGKAGRPSGANKISTKMESFESIVTILFRKCENI